jgi:predicted transcriptional regulator
MTLNYLALKQKLTEDIVRAIRENPDKPYDEIAQTFGVTRAVVRYRAKLAGIAPRKAGRIAGVSPQKAGR